MFLEHKEVEMPYSRFYAESSKEVYMVTNERDKRQFLAPDYHVKERFADFISGEDIFLSKAKKVTEQEIKAEFNGYYRSDLWNRPSQRTASKNH